MKFCWCTINVNHMEESLKFYQEIAGLPLIRKFSPGPGQEIAFLGEGDTQIELISSPNGKPAGKPEGVTLGFETASMEQMMAFVREKGLEIEAGPFQPNPHIRFFYVRDPNGVKIQFSENF